MVNFFPNVSGIKVKFEQSTEWRKWLVVGATSIKVWVRSPAGSW